MFGTVGVADALVFARALAAVAIVGVTTEARQALAACTVIGNHALRVCRTGETLADGQALENAQGVRSTGRRCGAVCVMYAVGYRGFFTR